jgi:PTS system, fructose subfamily, IIA component
MENFINENNIILNLETEDKREIINKMTETISEEKLLNKEKFIEDVFKREEMENTVVGFKVAIPHGKSEFINSPQIVFAKLKEEIFWGDPDEKVKYIFLLGVPVASAGEHIKILMNLSKKILDEKFREKLEMTDDKGKLLKIITE